MIQWLGLAPLSPGALACVVPVDDLRPHRADDPACWCRPVVDGGVLVHNSMDGRELFERGERTPS